MTIKKEFITPTKPEFLDNFRAYIFLNKENVDISDIQKRAIKEGYREQVDRHITIVGGRSSKVIRDALINQTSELVLNKLKSLPNEFAWQFRPGKIYHIHKEDRFGSENAPLEKREALIRIIEMPDINSFYKSINELLHINLPVQFPHITLFTKGESESPKYYGIGIRSMDEFNSLKSQEVQ
jgi:hypothetical protein